ncbi:MAG: TonB-dependent receptor [Bacteroidota bacterium]
MIRLSRCRLLIAGFFVLATAASTLAQTATVRGFVRDASDGQAMLGVNVTLRNDDGAFYGAATNSDGYFILNRIPVGSYVLRATFIGYEEIEEELTLAAEEIVTRRYDLEIAAIEGGEIVVEAEAEGAAGMQAAGLSTVRAADIERVPTAGVSADLASYLQTQSGVVAVGDRGGQLFVRGGTPTENLSLIDGIPLYQPFHVIGFYSAFPSDIIQSTDVYAGGFGARYGGRISSVLDVKTRSGNSRSFAGTASIDPFLVTGLVEGPIVPNRASILLSARQSIIEDTSPDLLDQDLPYLFWDRFGKLNVDINTTNSVSVTALRTYDRGNLSGLEELTDAETSALNTNDDQVVWDNQAYGVRFLHVPSTLPILATVLGSYSRLENTFGPADSPERTSAVQTTNASASLTYSLGETEIDAGLEVRNVKLEYNLGGLFQEIDEGEEFLTEASAFVESAIPLSDRFILRPGIRFSSFRGKATIEPRARVIWRPGGPEGNQQISAAWGLYRQDFAGLVDRRDAGDVFTAWVTSPVGDDVPGAMHAILGYEVEPTRWLNIGLEGYYKTLDNLLINEFTSFPRFSTGLQPADGRVYGVDLNMEINTPRFYGYLSYGLSEVAYDAQQESLEIWFGTDEITFNPSHDRRHQLNAVAQLDVYGFDLSVRWQLGSGLPFSQSAGFDTYVLLDSLRNVLEEPGDARVLYSEPYGGRLPVYHRLDVSLERDFAIGDRANAGLQIGLINAYDRRNLFYLDIFTLRRINQLPLIPSFGLKVGFR